MREKFIQPKLSRVKNKLDDVLNKLPSLVKRTDDRYLCYCHYFVAYSLWLEGEQVGFCDCRGVAIREEIAIKLGLEITSTFEYSKLFKCTWYSLGDKYIYGYKFNNSIHVVFASIKEQEGKWYWEVEKHSGFACDKETAIKDASKYIFAP